MADKEHLEPVSEIDITRDGNVLSLVGKAKIGLASFFGLAVLVFSFALLLVVLRHEPPAFEPGFSLGPSAEQQHRTTVMQLCGAITASLGALTWVVVTKPAITSVIDGERELVTTTKRWLGGRTRERKIPFSAIHDVTTEAVGLRQFSTRRYPLTSKAAVFATVRNQSGSVRLTTEASFDHAGSVANGVRRAVGLSYTSVNSGTPSRPSPRHTT